MTDDLASHEEWTAWVFDTCRMFGASLATCHKVAGVFADGTDPSRIPEASGHDVGLIQ